jgi:cytochrome b subunit of formate dehydrogenase
MSSDAMGNRPASTEQTGAAAREWPERIPRHAAVDRWFHWITAISVLTLLATSLLPIVGVRFSWVTIHWIAGIVLLAAVLFHIVRALFWQRLRCMWIGVRDVKSATSGVKSGKYSLAQKLMHHAMTLMVLVAVGTGIPMMIKAGTPFLKRDPYVFSTETWGILQLLHGAAALLAVTLVMVHIYFGVIKENRPYLRAMLRGWMSRDEWLARHDPARYPRIKTQQ